MLSNVLELRPTRRGYAVAAVALAAFLLGATGGARSLNAVVVPALVGLAASGLQLARADDPTIARSTPEPGFPGETRTVTLEAGSSVPCSVSEPIPGSLSERFWETAERRTVDVGHGGQFSYEVEFQTRGEHTIGPADCRLTDSLGLFTKQVETTETSTVLVYPDIYDIEGEELSGLVQRTLGDDRSSFDRLREFTPSDTMRDIHWKASARRTDEEFVVAEYRSRSEATHVDIVGEATEEQTDAMAAAVGSIALYLHEVGITVSVTVPDGQCVVTPGEQDSLLRLLALTDGGSVDDRARARADVSVSSKEVFIGGRELASGQLAATGTGRGGFA